MFTGIFNAILSRCDGATIGESCDKGNPIFIKLKEQLGQARAEEIMPQKTCDSGLECDCDVTQSEHEHGTRTSSTCRCVDSISKGISNFYFDYKIMTRVFFGRRIHKRNYK